MTIAEADLHIHTTCSDGAGTPLQVASALARSSLAVAAVTDHDRIEGALRVREALAGQGPDIVIGSEVTTRDGHLVALYIDRDLPPGRSARDTVDLIHDLGGLAIAPHPYFPIHSLGDLAAMLPFDAVEVANGTPLGELANRRARRRLGPLAKALVGGSDAHVLGSIGHVRTVFPGRTTADLRAAIESGQTKAWFGWGRHLWIAPRHVTRAAALMTRDAVRAAFSRPVEEIRAEREPDAA